MASLLSVLFIFHPVYLLMWVRLSCGRRTSCAESEALKLSPASKRVPAAASAESWCAADHCAPLFVALHGHVLNLFCQTVQSVKPYEAKEYFHFVKNTLSLFR